MSQFDQQTIISESSLGTYRSQDLNAGENRSQIDNAAFQSILQRMNKLEKENEAFRSLAFDLRILQKDRDELKKKNDELEKRVSKLENQLEIFKENTILANQERDLQIENVQKTAEIFSYELKKDEGREQLGQKVKTDFGEEKIAAEVELVVLDRSEILRSFGKKTLFKNVPAMNGLGHYYGNDAKKIRDSHDEDSLRRVLRAMAAGFTELNLKFYFQKNLEVTESGWTIRHQSMDRSYGGDGFWKMWLTFNGKRVDFQADADDIWYLSGKIYNSAKKLTPDSSGMVKLKGDNSYVRWNITIRK